MIDPMSAYPGYLLRRASAMAMARLAKRLKALRLNPTDATILSVVAANANATQSEIGRLLDIARANMAPLVSRLAERHLIERLQVDGRSHGLMLSHSGRALIPKINREFLAHEQELMGNVPVTQRKIFVAGLRALSEQMGAQEAKNAAREVVPKDRSSPQPVELDECTADLVGVSRGKKSSTDKPARPNVPRAKTLNRR